MELAIYQNVGLNAQDSVELDTALGVIEILSKKSTRELSNLRSLRRRRRRPANAACLLPLAFQLSNGVNFNHFSIIPSIAYGTLITFCDSLFRCRFRGLIGHSHVRNAPKETCENCALQNLT